MANLYHRSTNIMYTVPGDSERYFLLDRGAICVNCTRPVDMAGEVYYESRHDKDMVICSQCRRDIDMGRLDKIKIDDMDISDWIKRYEPL